MAKSNSPTLVDPFEDAPSAPNPSTKRPSARKASHSPPDLVDPFDDEPEMAPSDTAFPDLSKRAPVPATPAKDEGDGGWSGPVRSSVASLGRAAGHLTGGIIDTPGSIRRWAEAVNKPLREQGVPDWANPVSGIEKLSSWASEGVHIGDYHAKGTEGLGSAVSEGWELFANAVDPEGRAQKKTEKLQKSFDRMVEHGEVDEFLGDITDPEIVLNNLANAAPSLYAAIKSGGSPLFIALLESSEVNENAKEFEARTGTEVDPTDFAIGQAQAGAINTWLERIVPKGIADKLAGRASEKAGGFLRRLWRTAREGGKEAGTETLQEANINLATGRFDPDAEVTEGLPHAALGGFGAGTSMRGAAEAADAMSGQPTERDETDEDISGDVDPTQSIFDEGEQAQADEAKTSDLEAGDEGISDMDLTGSTPDEEIEIAGGVVGDEQVDVEEVVPEEITLTGADTTDTEAMLDIEMAAEEAPETEQQPTETADEGLTPEEMDRAVQFLEQDIGSRLVDPFEGDAADAQLAPEAIEQTEADVEEVTMEGPAPARVESEEQLEEVAQTAATSPESPISEPTDAQKRAGNYKKPKVKVNGFDVSIENPRGSKRTGKSRDGKQWSQTMRDHYGYIRGVKGKDKDHLDVFVTKEGYKEDRPIFVVDQVNEDGSFDEHKVVMGAPNMRQARRAYKRNYERGWSGLGAITQMTQDEFRQWTKGNTTKPVALPEAEKRTNVAQSRTEDKAAKKPDTGTGRSEKSPEETGAYGPKKPAQEPAARGLTLTQGSDIAPEMFTPSNTPTHRVKDSVLRQYSGQLIPNESDRQLVQWYAQLEKIELRPIAEKAQSNRLVGALEDLKGKSGMPAEMAGAVDNFFVHDADVMLDGLFVKMRHINRNAVSISESHINASATRLGTTHEILAHEIGHAVDYSRAGFDPYTVASERFDIGKDSFLVTDTEVKMDPSKMGDLMGEMVQVFTRNKQGLKTYLRYPLTFFGHLDSKISATEKAEILETIRTESFAQAFSLFYTHPQRLKAAAPKTYDFLQEIHDAYDGDRTPRQKNQRVREAFRLEGSAVGAQKQRSSGEEGRSGPGEGAARSSASKDAEQGYRDPGLVSRARDRSKGDPKVKPAPKSRRVDSGDVSVESGPRAIYNAITKKIAKGGEAFPKFKSGKRAGKPRGAPQDIDADQVAADAVNLFFEGRAARYWYRNSARRVLDIVGGDLAEAEKLIQLIALYSPQDNVRSNMQSALRAYAQYKNGQRIKVRDFAKADEKANKILYEGMAWDGRKTNSFYLNLMSDLVANMSKDQVRERLGIHDEEVLDRLQKAVTVDLWMSRSFGYRSDAKTDDLGSGAYSFIENVTRDIARLSGNNWKPHEVQAAIWTAIKARFEDPGVRRKTNKESLQKGYSYIEKEDGKEVVKRKSDAESKRKHAALWRKNAMAAEMDEKVLDDQLYDFSDAIDFQVGVFPYEAQPSADSGLFPGLNKATDMEQEAYRTAIADAFKDKDGHDILAKRLGLPHKGEIYGPGIWHGVVSPGAQRDVVLAPAKQKPDGRDLVGVVGAPAEDIDAIIDQAKSGQEISALVDAFPNTNRGDLQAKWKEVSQERRFMVDRDARQLMDLYSTIKGLMLRQDAAAWFRAFPQPVKERANGLHFSLGRVPSQNEVDRLEYELHQRFGADEFVPVPTPDGFYVLNFSPWDNKVFHEKAVNAVESTFTENTEHNYYAADGNLIENNWQLNPDGQEYRQGADVGRPDQESLWQWVRDVLAPRIDSVNETFAKQHSKWGTPVSKLGRAVSLARPLGQGERVVRADEGERDGAERDGGDSADQRVPALGTGKATASFFSEVTTGDQKHEPLPGSEYSPVMPRVKEGLTKKNRPLAKFARVYDSFRSKFDDHITFSIPGFKDVQMLTGSAILKVYGKRGEPADVLDIASSEGSWIKTITKRSGQAGARNKIRTVGIDPNPDMIQTFKDTGTVSGSTTERAAFTESEFAGETAFYWDDAETDPIKGYKPDRLFDVVHESMGFQFIGRDRDMHIARTKEMLRDDGVLLVEEKVSQDPENVDEWWARENQKDHYKLNYYTKQQVGEKAARILRGEEDANEGMHGNQVSQPELERILKQNFKHVVQYWDSGNFKGYLASDSPAQAKKMADAIGDTKSEFAHAETPRWVGKRRRQRFSLPANEDGQVELTHWGKLDNLLIANPRYHGTGMRGAERSRKEADPDNYIPRTYFGAPGYRKEAGVGPNEYEAAVDPDTIYDFKSDPDGLMDAAREQAGPGENQVNVYERLIHESGYSGYFVDSVVARFDRTPVRKRKPIMRSTQTVEDLAMKSMATFVDRVGRGNLTTDHPRIKHAISQMVSAAKKIREQKRTRPAKPGKPNVSKKILESKHYEEVQQEAASALLGFAREIGDVTFAGDARMQHIMDTLVSVGVKSRNKAPIMRATAYHASPHEFDQFDISKIGTGEGNQVIAYGLYFGEHIRTGQSYYQKFRLNPFKFPDVPDNNMVNEARMTLRMANLDKDLAKSIVDKRWPGMPDFAREINEVIDQTEINEPSLYTVEIPDSEVKNMIEWELPLNQQPQHIQDAIVSGDVQLTNEPFSEWGGATGSAYVKMLEQALGRKEAAQYLNSIGIKGVKYLDQGSRDAGTGTLNYVVFDDSILSIIDRNGEPVQGNERTQVLRAVRDETLTGGRLSPAEVRDILAGRIGEDAVARLEGAGVLNIVQSHEDLPAAVQEGGVPTDKGAYDPGTGQAYLIADNLGDDTAFGTLLHEVGEHYGLMNMIGGDRHRKILSQLRKLHRAGNKRVRAARARVPESTPKEHVWDETLAYLAENPENHNMGVLREVWVALRNFLRKNFGIAKQLNTDELTILVRGALNRAAGTARTTGTDVTPMRAAPADMFYSQMQRSLQEKLPNKGTPESLKKQIQNLAKKGNFKQEELEWSGVLEWLDGIKDRTPKTVTKDEVMDFLRANQIKVEEVHKSGEKRFFDDDGNPTDELIEEFFGQQDDASDVRAEYAQWQTPGGENYRELLLTLPEISPAQGAGHLEIRERDGRFEVWNKNLPNPEAPFRVQGYRSRQEAEQHIAEAAAQPEGEYTFSGGHFKEPNVLAHVRFNERTDSEGNRVLFVEEVQSDWHQKGRKSGYKSDDMSKTAARAEFSDEGWVVYNEDGVRLLSLGGPKDSDPDHILSRAQRLIDEQPTSVGATAVPDAPFKQTWPLLAMKRMIRYAAENGFDKVAWTTGDMQVDRYEDALRQRVDRISWEHREGEGKVVRVEGPRPMTISVNTKTGVVMDARLTDGSRIQVSEAVGKSLDDVVGKDIAEQIMEQDRGDLSGEGLSVGGAGMRSFYDKMLPSSLNKYVKKWGAKVGTAEVDVVPEGATARPLTFEQWLIQEKGQGMVQHMQQDSESQNRIYEEWEQYISDFNKKSQHRLTHALPITPQMRKAVMDVGQPLFSRSEGRGTNTDSENFKRWFGDSKVVDENGEPLVVYHGTPRGGFTEFEDQSGQGIFFSSSPLHARSYSGTMEEFSPRTPATGEDNLADEPGPMNYDAYLRIENPLIIDFEGNNWDQGPPERVLLDEDGDVVDWAYSDAEAEELVASGEASAWEIRDQEHLNTHNLAEEARLAGADGVIIKNITDSGVQGEWSHEETVYIVLEPTQIKSTGNRGTYDPSDPNILRSAAAPTAYSEANRKIREEDQTTWRRAKRMLRRQLTPGGLLPRSVFGLKITRDSQFEVIEFDVRHIVGNFERAIRRAYKRRAGKLTEGDKKILSDALAGKDMPGGLAQEVKTAVVAMRSYIDKLSREYVQILNRQVDDMRAQFDEGEQVLFDAVMRMQEVAPNSDSAADRAKATRKKNQILEQAKDQAAEIWGSRTGMQKALSNVMETAQRAALMKTVSGNVGKYVHRSYKAFDDPSWAKRVPDDVQNRAREYLATRNFERAESLELRAQELAEAGHLNRSQEVWRKAESLRENMDTVVQRQINEILKVGTAYDSMEAFIREGKLGQMDMSILQRRKEVPKAIRDLLGEHSDPRVNFAKSATKMGRLIWNQRFLEKVQEVGKGTFLWRADDESRPAEAYVEIAADKSYEPLAGYVTFPEVEQAFRDALGKEQMANWYKWIVQLNGMIKYGKTVGSPTTAARNWQSAAFFALANGHIDWRHMGKSVSGMREYFTQQGKGSRLRYLRELKELGVVYDTPYAGEMMRLLDDSDIQDRLKGSEVALTLEKGLQYATKFYQFGDDFWKIIGFENEKALLMKHAGMSEQEAKVEAAERIRNTYPTYSMVGRLIKNLRRFPPVGTFVSFPAEIIRTSANMVKYIHRDWNTPGMRPIAARRAIGLASVAAFAYALQALTRAWFDVDDDEEDAMRVLAAPWNKNSNVLFLGRDEDGNLVYEDISFLDPYNIWKRPVTAIFRDDSDWQDRATSALGDTLGPFFGTDIGFGAISEVWSNKRHDTGGPVYGENDLWDDQIWDITTHLTKSLQPGISSNLYRTWLALDGQKRPSGREYDKAEEGLAWIGHRLSTLDPKVSAKYLAYDFSDQKRAAGSRLSRTLQDPNEISEGDIDGAVSAALKIRNDAFRDMIRVVNSAKIAGATNREIEDALRSSGVAKRDVRAMLDGRWPEFELSKQSEKYALRNAEALHGEEHADRLRERYDLARDKLRDREKERESK